MYLRAIKKREFQPKSWDLRGGAKQKVECEVIFGGLFVLNKHRACRLSKNRRAARCASWHFQL